MKLPKDIKYTEDHEWVLLKDDVAIVGITDFAQSELGDIIFIENPPINQEVKQKDSIGTIEAVKTVADIFAPVSGLIIEVNDLIESTPELINESPFSNGWILKIKVRDQVEYDNLLSSSEYEKLIK